MASNYLNISQEIQVVCGPIVDGIRSAINQEHSLSISEILLLQTRSVPKTSSGKIARAWCRKGYLAKSLDVVYSKSFRTNTSTFEIEDSPPAPAKALSPEGVEKLRAMDKKEILTKLIKDMGKIGSVSPEAVQDDAPIASLMDSLSVSQFKGLLEAEYAVKISDEYLFRESTTPKKLVEVVKLGYAPDDGDGSNAAMASTSVGQSTGLAGALGCPPGVVCVIL